MLSDVIKLGDKIDVTHLDRLGKPAHNARTYVSQLIDYYSGDIIQIATPIVSSTPIVLNVGENYQLCFYTAKGLYQCNCTVLKNQKEGNIITVFVRIITKLERYQRRQYFRLECIHDISYRVISREEEILENKLKSNECVNEDEVKECKKRLLVIKNIWFPATIKDISGGGTRFTSAAVHEQGDRLELKLKLALGSTIREMMIGADIISAERVVNRVGLYEYRVEFNEISKKDREDLIKYIFEQERKRR